ncbi:MAG TPA: UDP-N-acetylmuramate--L-alanine ligase [Chitinophagaceae bacterium]|nr:UDP-N-acetylmuramate--L-alanine ligase [Chitinophagaceae bacterium]
MNEKRKTTKSVSSIYFIGIGGIGMSALARYFHSKGVKVSGYDKTPSSLTKELEQAGISIHYEEDVELIPKDAELVVYTPAVPGEHKELVYYQKSGYKVVKRSDVLQLVTESSFNICIAGTHGKTTITTLVAHLLRHSGYGCNAFLGGISVNYGTNFWPQPVNASERDVSVVEADEYDRSFLKLSPDVAIITAMDPDHLDIYGTADEMERAFIDFSGRIKPGGLLISKFGLKRAKELKGARHLTYSVQNANADACAENIKMMNGSYQFDVVIEGKRIENVRLNIGGMHNVENAVAAIVVASSLNIDKEKIKAAVADFRGVKRRFEYIIKTDNLVFIDDYAHHPEELRALINGVRSLFSDKKCTVIFQPHLYTRTRDLADGFAEVLDMADEAILLPVYPARELPIAGVSSEMILNKMKNKNKMVLNKEELKAWIEKEFKKQGKVLVTAGAGDIDLLVEPIKQNLK